MSHSQENRCAGGRVKCSRTHIDALLAANAKQVQQSKLNVRRRAFGHTREGDGIILSRRCGIMRFRRWH